MSGMYIFAGIMHFVKPRLYKKVIPPYLPRPALLVTLSGIAEIILGIALLVPSLRTYAIWGLILMLLVFLPVHIYMLQKNFGMPRWMLWLRIPLQFLLIWWAYFYLDYPYL